MKASSAISSSRTVSPAAPPRKRASSSSTERFALSGPSPRLDPLYNAYRGDLADVALASRLFAPHYAEPVTRALAEATSLFKAPGHEAEELGALSKGEDFALLDITGGWAWGYRMSDHLVGYVKADCLA